MLVRSCVSRPTLPLRLLSSRSPSIARCVPPESGSGYHPIEHRRSLYIRRERPFKRKAFRALAGFNFGFDRNLATALGDYQPLESIQYDGLPGTRTSSRYPQPLYELRPVDVTRALSIRDETTDYPKTRIDKAGIPGSVDEMVSVFEACVDVGKLDRASQVLIRLGKLDYMAPEDLVELHNCFLQERVAQIQESPVLDGADDVHKWFELRIRSRGLPHTPETIAYMIKASLLTTHGSRLDRLIDRYMSMLPEDTALESLFMADVLSAKDLATVVEICPTYNMPEQSSLMSQIPLDEEVDEADRLFQPVEPVSYPEVASTPQKGMGLRSLQETLTLFSEIPVGCDIASLSRSERREFQARLERDCVDAALRRWREENETLQQMGVGTALSLGSLGARLYEWQVALRERFAKEMVLVDEAEKAEKKSAPELQRCFYGPFLRQCDPDRLAAVTIISVLNVLSSVGADKGAPIGTTVSQVVKAAEEDLRHQKVLRANSKGHNGARRRNRSTIARQNISPLKADEDGVITVTDVPPINQPWPATIRAKFGAMLISFLLETAKMTVVREHPVTKATATQIQPAFTHTTQLNKGKKINILYPNPALIEILKKEPSGDVLARQLPMVAEPEPWTKFDKGGFIECPVPLVRVKANERDQKHYADAAIARGDMDQVLKGLDVLGKTAWKVNRPVLDVMLEAWNSGEKVANLPALNPDIPIPPEPDSSIDPMARRGWLKLVKLAENARQGQHSVRCFINFQLEIARAFRDQTFYFPHNVDFRGRAYPLPTYLNHMGADHVRGLLRFAKGKALGENGLRWLKVQLANLHGFDKASLKDREGFVDAHLEDIYDSAANPLGGRGWWLKAEDPWQCLAACFELRAALASPDPTQFVSHLPVHQDGTCNGLQHYAALGGDVWGAQQVNLVPAEKPADIYSAVANIVEELIAKDAANGDRVAQALVGKIKRKVVKQTVMTNVYGVTYMGARAQVAKQLHSLYPNLTSELGVEVTALSAYIAKQIFTAMSTLFRGAHEIQEWLLDVGGRVCRAITPEQIERIVLDAARSPKNSAGQTAPSDKEVVQHFQSSLVWTTPLRMPVVQPYRKVGTRTIETCLQALVIPVPGKSDTVNRQKQLQAFPPNFIHSLDASHMLLTALECHELGLTFAAVHDSFWTHAADVDTMNGVIRDSFIRIHSDDVMGRLAAEFAARYRGSLYLESVNRKSAVGKIVLAHRQTQRKTLVDELGEEHLRQKLLRSDDPEDVKRGEGMVTPASIFESMQDAKDSIVPEVVTPVDDADAAGAVAPIGVDTGFTAGIEPAEDDETIEVGAEAATDVHSWVQPSQFVGTLKGTRAPKRPQKPETYHIWLPLSFPELPSKGDFDVRQLKDSKYFFS